MRSGFQQKHHDQCFLEQTHFLDLTGSSGSCSHCLFQWFGSLDLTGDQQTTEPHDETPCFWPSWIVVVCSANPPMAHAVNKILSLEVDDGADLVTKVIG